MSGGYDLCFAYGVNECLCLNVKLCALGIPCRFFKTKKQLQSEQEKANIRLAELGLTEEIIKKYR